MKESKINIFNYKHFNKKEIKQQSEKIRNNSINSKLFFPNFSTFMSPKVADRKLSEHKEIITLVNIDETKKKLNNEDKVKTKKTQSMNLETFSQCNKGSINKHSRFINLNLEMLDEDGLLTKSLSLSTEKKELNENDETKDLIFQGRYNFKKDIKIRTISARNKVFKNKFNERIKNYFINNNSNNKYTSINVKQPTKINIIDYSSDLINKRHISNKMTPTSKVNISVNRDYFNTSNQKVISSSPLNITKRTNYFNKSKFNLEVLSLSPKCEKINPVNILKEKLSVSRIKRNKKKKSLEVNSKKIDLSNVIITSKMKDYNEDNLKH